MISELAAKMRLQRPEQVFEDAYWEQALQAALRAAEVAVHVLVPEEFLPLHPRFAPLEYSWALDPRTRLAWCCSKDDVDRLAPWLHETAGEPAHCAWANEVFVLGSAYPWPQEADAHSRRHFTAWQERLAHYRGGVPSRAANERPVEPESAGAAHPGNGPRVLVVGASNMGNVGDDLLAEVLAGMLAEHGAEVFLSGPDIDPLRVRDYDQVIVGGGGLVYASRDGTNETQNLANYLKFGPIGAHFGVPTAMIGVGHQDHAGMIEADALSHEFATRAIAQFGAITTRDPESTALFDMLGAADAHTASDLLFAWTQRARFAVKPSVTLPGRIAFVGQIYDHPFLAEQLGDREASFAAQLADGDFDVLVMSDDDVEHARRLNAELRATGASASVVDLRGRDFETLVFLFGSYRSVITTRFHGFVLAALAGVPALAVDSSGGKLARLLRESGLDAAASLDDADERPSRRLGEALAGALPVMPTEMLDTLAAKTAVHRQTIAQLIVECAGAQASQTDQPGAADQGGVAGRAGAVDQAGATNRAGAAAPAQQRRALRSADADRAASVDADRAASADDDAGECLDRSGAVRLCWAASSIETAGYANLGDSLSAVVVAALADRRVRHESFDAFATKLVAVGSIGHAIRHGRAVFWGTGVSIRGGILAQNFRYTDYDVRALRGRISAQHFRDFGVDVPDVYGDPVWLLPAIYDAPVEKRYELGIVPHIQDIDWHHPDAPTRPDSMRCLVDERDADDVVVINTWHEPTWDGLLKKLDLIRSCKRILSQSFHGLVLAEAYGIPCLNFRHLPGADNGVVRVDLDQECSTDPRVWEFYRGGERAGFEMYSQRRDERTDFDAAMRAIDVYWQPFEFDAEPLVRSFPLPLAFDPLREKAHSLQHVEALTF